MTAPQDTPAPPEAPPLWDWAQIQQLQPGDRIQHESRSPVNDPWLTVVSAARGFRHQWAVHVAEKVDPAVVGLADDNVRRAIPDHKELAA